MGKPGRSGANVVLGALALSEVGDRFVLAAMPIVALRLDSPAFLAAVLVAATLPSVLLSGLVTRLPALRTLRAWRIALLGQLIAWALAAVVASASAWLLIGFVLAAGILDVVAMPYSRAALHQVGADDVAGLTKRWSTAKSLAGALGMGAGALIASAFGLLPVLLVNAATFALTLAVTYRAQGLGKGDEQSRSARRTVVAAEGSLLTRPEVFGALGFTAVVAMLSTTSVEGVIGPFMLETLSGFSPRMLGFVMAAWALGAVFASAFAPARTQTHGAALPAACLMVALALGVPATGAVPFAWAFAFFFLGGVGNGIFNLSLSRTIWDGVAPEHQASAWAAFNRALNATILSAFVIGLVAASDHAPVVLLVMASLLGLVAVTILLRASLPHWRPRLQAHES